jgi:hypothetical protein
MQGVKMDNWVNDEFFDLSLGDVRVNKSAKKVISELGAQPGASIPQIFETSSEVNFCYNFFHNGKVTAEKILEPHIKRTIERIKSEPVILLPQDTTSLNYSNKLSLEDDLGNISGKNNQGLFVHPLLAITPLRVNLGIVDAKIWAREQRSEELTRKEIYSLPIEEKERFRWAESYNVACQIAVECPTTQVITIADREGDFAELFEIVCEATTKDKFAHIIVRGSHDRALIDDNSKKLTKKQKDGLTIEEMEKIEEEKKIQIKLKLKLQNSPILGEISFSVPATKNRTARMVTQVIKTAKIKFKKRTANGLCVEANVVMAIEESPPEGEPPLVWWFLTTLPIDTFEQATLVIQYYLARWEIEFFFKTLKSGCKVEERALTNGAIIPLISVFLVITWRILYAMKLGRTCPNLSSEALFTSSEWKSVYKVMHKGSKLPESPPLLGEFVVMIARLGGYLNRKNDPPPGPTVMWRGFRKMETLVEAWESFGHD